MTLIRLYTVQGLDDLFTVTTRSSKKWVPPPAELKTATASRGWTPLANLSETETPTYQADCPK